MKTLRISIRVVAAAWLVIGCVALAGLLRGSDAQLVGRLLTAPAMILGSLRVPPGILFKVSQGWPILTLAGVALVYFVAPAVFFVATRRRGERAAA